jgi:hypothetical protein
VKNVEQSHRCDDPIPANGDIDPRPLCGKADPDPFPAPLTDRNL